MGQPIYSAVDASVVNGGIMTMEASGGGQTQTGLWLNWDASTGFTNGAVSWDKLKPYIEYTGWPSYSHKLGAEYSESYDSFISYLGTNPTELNGVLGDDVWRNKPEFIDQYWSALTYPTGRPGPVGCLDWAN